MLLKRPKSPFKVCENCVTHIYSVFCICILISVPTACPDTHPFAFAGGEACCQFFTTKPGVAGCANPDGGDLDFNDPVECCPRPHLDCEDDLEGCKNYPYAWGEGYLRIIFCLVLLPQWPKVPEAVLQDMPWKSLYRVWQYTDLQLRHCRIFLRP